MKKQNFLYRIGLLFSVFCIPNTLVFGDTLFIKKSSHYSEEINTRKFEDADCKSNINELKIFEKLQKQELLGKCYWSELIIKNTSNNSIFAIEFTDPHVGKIILFEKTGNHSFTKIVESGFSNPFQIRNILHKNHSSIFQLDKNKSKTFYIHHQNQVESGTAALIKPIHSFVSYSLNEYIGLGIFYGVLLLLLTYNFLLFFTNKQAYYLWYVAYILCCCIQTFNENGIGFQYLWPSFPQINYLLYDYGALLLAISFLGYSKSFLGDKYLNIRYFFALIALLVGSHFVFKIDFIHRFWTLPYLSFFGYILYVSTKGFKQIVKPFSFFTIGNLVLLTSFLILLLRIFGLVPSFWLTVYFFNFGFILEGVIFSYAMAHRLNKAHLNLESAQLHIIEELKEKELLKDKVNRELEQKVVERTQTVENQKLELVKLNDDLKEFQKKINYINSELDKDNYKLKRSLVEAKKEKVLKRLVSFEEFTGVFKTENECLKHLVELKWTEEFKCKKCISKNASIVPKTHNRKCTSCKHIESPTANTIFHGIKFPLNKAFYIVYLTHYSKKEFTLDEISLELELRRNTLWSFRKKVLDRKESLLKSNKIVVNSPWERLIVD